MKSRDVLGAGDANSLQKAEDDRSANYGIREIEERKLEKQGRRARNQPEALCSAKGRRG